MFVHYLCHLKTVSMFIESFAKNDVLQRPSLRQLIFLLKMPSLRRLFFVPEMPSLRQQIKKTFRKHALVV